jgi:hypothetical protein
MNFRNKSTDFEMPADGLQEVCCQNMNEDET